jgi:hypothetical protein
MASKPGLLHLPNHGKSALVKSNAVSSIVARGREEAAALATRESENMTSSSQSSKSSPQDIRWTKVIDEVGKLIRANEEWERQNGVVESTNRYREAAEHGDADAQYEIGDRYKWGVGIHYDHEQAAFWYSKAAQQGHGEAQISLACLYFEGRGVRQDYVEAYFWFDVAISGEMTKERRDAVAEFRARTASHLSSTELYRAQEQVQKWFEDHPAEPLH